MSDSTFKPTHVRCVKGDGKYFTTGRVYPIMSWEVPENPSLIDDNGCPNFAFKKELKSKVCVPRFRYVGPPAILGDPK